LAGGDGEALETVRGVFEPITSKALRRGPSGAGHTTKLLNNFLHAVSL